MLWANNSLIRRSNHPIGQNGARSMNLKLDILDCKAKGTYLHYIWKRGIHEALPHKRIKRCKLPILAYGERVFGHSACKAETVIQF
jgi:hypothetical protein